MQLKGLSELASASAWLRWSYPLPTLTPWSPALLEGKLDPRTLCAVAPRWGAKHILVPSAVDKLCFAPQPTPGGSGSSLRPPSPRGAGSKASAALLLCLSFPSEGSGGPGCAMSWGSTSSPSTLFAYCSQLLLPAHGVSSAYTLAAQSCFRRQQEEKRNEIQPPCHSKHQQFAVLPTPQHLSPNEPCPVHCKTPVPPPGWGIHSPQNEQI